MCGSCGGSESGGEEAAEGGAALRAGVPDTSEAARGELAVGERGSGEEVADISQWRENERRA